MLQHVRLAFHTVKLFDWKKILTPKDPKRYTSLMLVEDLYEHITRGKRKNTVFFFQHLGVQNRRVVMFCVFLPLILMIQETNLEETNFFSTFWKQTWGWKPIQVWVNGTFWTFNEKPGYSKKPDNWDASERPLPGCQWDVKGKLAIR